MSEAYNIDDLRIDGQRVPGGSMAVGVDWGHGSDEAAVALLERKPAGNYEVKWSAPLNRRESMRLTGRSEHICWKCRDGRTRAHHRRCSKRGGKIERFLAAYQAEALAAFRGSPSPSRLKGLAKGSAMFLGERAAISMRESERMLDRFRPDRATGDDLRALASLYGVA